jgi:outer membrane protein assembly factor BamB
MTPAEHEQRPRLLIRGRDSCATVANEVVVTTTSDGHLYAFSTEAGRMLWETRMRAGVNACPAVAGDLLLVGAGVPFGRGSTLELVIFELG